MKGSNKRDQIWLFPNWITNAPKNELCNLELR